VIAFYEASFLRNVSDIHYVVVGGLSVADVINKSYHSARRTNDFYCSVEKIYDRSRTRPRNWAIDLLLVLLTQGVYMLDHRLRGSASPVLTATGFANGKGQFSTPYAESTPLNRSPKIWDSLHK